ncbi:hypothetical protein GGR56DRAFT_695606 [Xylariaceae sp. FL0804]|nr:hypothetical protein GGR56DRAFT_695606 [Xylariaceae sp. FL0804]
MACSQTEPASLVEELNEKWRRQGPRLLDTEQYDGFLPSFSVSAAGMDWRRQPRSLKSNLADKITRLIWDLTLAAVALLFTVFGAVVKRYDGSPAGPGTVGLKLYEISKYGPTIFPVLFAAIVGGSLKSIVAWSVQSRRGTTVGTVELCLGSLTISSAFITPYKVRTLGLTGLLIILVWCFSPLGSQASLRVISIVPEYPEHAASLTTLSTFATYQYGFAAGYNTAQTIIAGPVAGSMSAASLLANRNQDLWGNVRIPGIERLENGGQGKENDTGWFDVPPADNLTYPSLVGTPVANLSGVGNTSFVLPGSYLALSCPVLRERQQGDGPVASDGTGLTNFSSPDASPPGNGFDCTWSAESATYLQVALSMPCRQSLTNYTTTGGVQGTRQARRLIWESVAGDEAMTITRAECELTTSHVDAAVSCTDSPSGRSSGSTCTASAARRSSPSDPSSDDTVDGNWTVLDLGGALNAPSVTLLLVNLFPSAGLSATLQPVATYINDPFHALVATLASGAADGDLAPQYAVGRAAFEVRLAQLLNSVLLLGTDPTAFTGGGSLLAADVVDPEGESQQQVVSAVVATRRDVVRADPAWLAVLLVASLLALACAVLGAALRAATLAPDVLGSTGMIMLRNRVEGVHHNHHHGGGDSGDGSGSASGGEGGGGGGEGECDGVRSGGGDGAVVGSSTWSGSRWARALWDTRIRLGDIEPEAEVGRIALVTSDTGGQVVSPVNTRRYYL